MGAYAVEIFDDPLAYPRRRSSGTVTLNLRRRIPDEVPIGHIEGIEQIVDEVVSREAYLELIQQACAELGDRLEVRFFDHSVDGGFDASVLDRLDEIRALAIDSVAHASNLAAVARLPKLRHLRYGSAFTESAGAIGAMDVARLESFTLAGTPTPTIDLSPLGRTTTLRSLRLLGRGKNTAAIGSIASLRELAMHPSPKESLAFLGQLRELEVLKLVLGRKQSIADVPALPALRDLSCYEVALLEDLGDLQRFPRLRRLQLSDLKRLAEIVVGPHNSVLEHIRLYSVPSLRAVQGLAKLSSLKSLYAYDSQLTPAWRELPPTLSHFQLVTKRTKGRDEHDADVRAHGLVPDAHPDASFFYK